MECRHVLALEDQSGGVDIHTIQKIDGQALQRERHSHSIQRDREGCALLREGAKFSGTEKRPVIVMDVRRELTDDLQNSAGCSERSRVRKGKVLRIQLGI